jgi:N-terminal domain of toast_rack, DUF2154/Domain of unknown function (DUF5668)
MRERRGFVFPIILIIVGALFLYANYSPAFDPWRILGTYWPIILILLGLGKIWDHNHRQAYSEGRCQSSVGTTIGIVAAILVLTLLVWHGRSHSRQGAFASSSLQHSSQSVDRKDAKSVTASLQTGAGQLNIAGGSSHLLDADFSVSSSYPSPTVDYSVDGGVGHLRIKQGDESAHFISQHNEWNLHFGNTVPLDLTVVMGAGQGRLNLRGLALTRLQVEMGAGTIDVDLTGDRENALDADIEGGVGQATIRLPKNVGVLARASGGIGGISARGFNHDGDDYTNSAYGKTPGSIHLTVQGGVGEITLLEE